MPSPESQRLTALHRRRLRQLAERVERSMALRTAVPQPADVDAWWTSRSSELVEQVRAAWTVSSGLGDRYLRQHAALNGVSLDPVGVQWDPQRAETSLRVAGPVAFKTHMRETGDVDGSWRTMRVTIGGAATRLALSGERDMVIDSIFRRPQVVGYRRVTDGSPCAFCAMLASRGAVYLSRERAEQVVGRGGFARGTRAIGESYHDSCNCTTEPLYDTEEEPPEVDELFTQWREGGSTVRSFRRHWDSSPQVRARYAELVAQRGT